MRMFVVPFSRAVLAWKKFGSVPVGSDDEGRDVEIHRS